MATKTGVVRAGRTVHLGEPKGSSVATVEYGPGDEVKVDEKEFDRLVDIGALAKPGSPEAKSAAAAADQLPGNFPGVEALRKAGIDTYSAVEAVDDFTEVKGIGDATAAEIEKALKAREG